MILHFPERNEKIEKISLRRTKLPEGEWTVLPSRLTFLVPLTLPSKVLRGLTEMQLQNLAFDRVPIPANASRMRLLVPKLGFLSRGTSTAWAVIAPLSALPADFEKCLPEDLLLATLAWDKRFKKGGFVVLDSPACMTMVGMNAGAKNSSVWKQMVAGPQGIPEEIAPSVSGLLGPGAFFLRLNGGGHCESLLDKYGKVVTEEASESLANRISELVP